MSGRVTAVLFVAVLAIGCGKKGPPLPPIVHIPTSVDQISARRIGSDVFVTMTVPAENIDKTKPADVGRIEVFAYTGTIAPPKGRFLEVASRVAMVDVAPPVTTDTKTPDNDGAKQGAPVTVREHLTEESLVARPLPPPAEPERRRRAVLPAAAPAKEGALRRFYMALSFSPRGRFGPPGTIAELPLTALPDAPLGVTATSAADAVSVAWEPAGGLIGFLLERALPLESSPIDEPAVADSGGPRAPGADGPAGPTRYNVYREIEPLPGEAADPAHDVNAPAVPLNGAPIAELTFAEPLSLLDGRRRCYTVRAVRGTGAAAIEGEASVPSCVTPTDVSAPAAPVGLTTTIEPGSIGLTWEPNTETDLAGYVVLRGEAGDATLTPLTGEVLTEPRFVDKTVKPGVQYVYAVIAIDTHLPRPNPSAESERLEVTAK